MRDNASLTTRLKGEPYVSNNYVNYKNVNEGKPQKKLGVKVHKYVFLLFLIELIIEKF